MNVLKVGCRNLEIKVSGKKYNKSLFVTGKVTYNGTGYTVKCETLVEENGATMSRLFAQSVMVDVLPKIPNNGISFSEFLSEVLMEFSGIVTGEENDVSCNKLMTALILENFQVSPEIYREIITDTQLIHSMFVERRGNQYIEVAFVDGDELYFELEPYNVGLKGKVINNFAEIEFKIL